MKLSRVLSALCICFFCLSLVSCGGGVGLVKKRLAEKPSLAVVVFPELIRGGIKMGGPTARVPQVYKKIGPVVAKIIRDELGIKKIVVIDPVPMLNYAQIDYSKINADVIALVTVTGKYNIEDGGAYKLTMSGSMNFTDVKTKSSIGGFTAGHILNGVSRVKKTKLSNADAHSLVLENKPEALLKKYIKAQKSSIKEYLQKIKTSEIPK